MTTTVQDIADLEPQEMERAYLEYRKACYDIVYRTALDHGVLDHLDKETSLDEFAQRAGVVPDKVWVAGLLLDALTKYGALTRTAGSPARYTVVPGGPTDRELDERLIFTATGKRTFEQLQHSENYSGILNALTTEANPVSASFDATNLALWEEVLQAPFYRYSRVQAVREIVGAGSKLLDLACGPGFGLRELAESATDGKQAQVLGVEISRDFVKAAIERNAEDDRVRIVQGNLEKPLDFVRSDYFDGAMIVGAYHFLQHPEELWRTAARVLRPGGTFCVAYALSKVGSYDQEIMELRFALRKPVSYLPTREEVLAQAEANGMRLSREFKLGCWCWYAFVKD